MVWDKVKKAAGAIGGGVIGGTIAGPLGWAAGAFSGSGGGSQGDREAKAQMEGRMKAQERKDLLQEGLQYGRERGEMLTGQNMQQTGRDVQDIVSRRREMVGMPSRAESMIRSQGQMQERRARSAGASEAQQRQIALDSSRMAGVQGDIDRERRLANFQKTMDSVMKTQSALEAGFGEQYLASQYIPPAIEQPGALGRLTGGVSDFTDNLLSGLGL